MTTRLLATSWIALAVLSPTAALAAASPHDVAWGTTGCTTCHSIHSAQGASLTKKEGNAAMCRSCHTETASPANRFQFPWLTGEQAMPGASGRHHNWDSPAISDKYGAQMPSNSTLLKTRSSDGTYYYFPGGSPSSPSSGYIQCSSCHNEHAPDGGAGFAGVRTSITPGIAIDRNAKGSGTGKMILNVVEPVTPRSYLLEITVPGNIGTAKFRVSNNGGTSWLGWNGTAWVTWTASPDNSRLIEGGAIPLNGAGTTVTFVDGSFNVAPVPDPTEIGPDQWKFYVSYPFLRVTNVDDALCVDCHKTRDQKHPDVEGTIPEGQTEAAFGWAANKAFSHPVGQTLNENLKNYDVAAPLDVNGGAQGSAEDANPSNNIRLSSTGKVLCQSCHAVHNADSNSQTVDAR